MMRQTETRITGTATEPAAVWAVRPRYDEMRPSGRDTVELMLSLVALRRLLGAEPQRGEA
jgi:hypothetical protein